jgi:mycofactocin precursor peptide MftA
MPYYCDLDHIVETSTRRKVLLMEPNQLDGTETGAATAATSGAELVTETLVEEVSIDGMCGVY